MTTLPRLTPAEKLTLIVIDRLEGEHATYAQMASIIGVARSTFGEVIRTLKDRGLVEVSGSRRFPQRRLTRRGRMVCRGFDA